jgi:hypothetical protein
LKEQWQEVIPANPEFSSKSRFLSENFSKVMAFLKMLVQAKDQARSHRLETTSP